jgi:hypothetical protein
MESRAGGLLKADGSSRYQGVARAMVWIASVIGTALFFAACTTRNVQIATGAGQTQSLEETKGDFAPAGDARFQIYPPELGAVMLDNDKYVRWAFSFRDNQPGQLRSVRVENISDQTPEVLVEDTAPELSNGIWTGYSGAIEPNLTEVPWLFDSSQSTRLFRFTIIDLDGNQRSFVEGARYPVSRKRQLITKYGLKAQ